MISGEHRTRGSAGPSSKQTQGDLSNTGIQILNQKVGQTCKFACCLPWCYNMCHVTHASPKKP